jgi:MYXO-CTERM domain-containing protein
VEALGFATANPYDTFITRLRFRYTPEQATGELSLYESGRTEATVTSFAVAGDGTECLETCATAEEEPAGEGSDGSDGGADGAVDDPDTVTEPKGGCATAPSAGLGAALVGLLGLLGLRRRRAD